MIYDAHGRLLRRTIGLLSSLAPETSPRHESTLVSAVGCDRIEVDEYQPVEEAKTDGE